MNKLPDIDIIICCFNSEKYLNDTLKSIINQTYKKWRIIIVDDGSTDNTKEIVHNYINKKTPIIYQRNELNMGFGTSRQIAFERCTHDWIAIIDHDDLWYPDKLEVQVNSIINNPDAKLFFSNSEWFNNDEKILRLNLDKEKYNTGILKNAFEILLLDGCIIDTETVVINRQALESIGGFNRNFAYIADYDIFLKIAKLYDVYYDNKILAKWRVHEKQASQKMTAIMIEEHIRLLELIAKNKGNKKKITKYLQKKLVNLYRAFASDKIEKENIAEYFCLLFSSIKIRPLDPVTYLKFFKSCYYDLKKLIKPS